MSLVDRLLRDLEDLGAKVESTGQELILRAGPKEIPAALVRLVRESKSDLLALLSRRHDCPTKGVVEWLDSHPASSAPGRCCWCGKPETASAVVLPFGTAPGTHAWLHAECWPDWHRSRLNDARRTLEA